MLSRCRPRPASYKVKEVGGWWGGRREVRYPARAAVRRRLQTQWGWLRAGLTLWHVRGTKKRDGEF